MAKAGKVVKQGSSANNNIALKNTTESQDEIEEPEPIAKVQPASEQNNSKLYNNNSYRSYTGTASCR